MAWINDGPRTEEEIQVEDVRRRLLSLPSVIEEAEAEWEDEARERENQEEDSRRHEQLLQEEAAYHERLRNDRAMGDGRW